MVELIKSTFKFFSLQNTGENGIETQNVQEKCALVIFDFILQCSQISFVVHIVQMYEKFCIIEKF